MSEPGLIKPTYSFFFGIDDEVVALFAVVIVFLATIGFLLVKNIARVQHLHPAAADQVAAVLRGRANSEQSGANDEERTSADFRSPRQLSGTSNSCPICLERATYIAETSCGHVFCGLCITQLCEHHGQGAPIDCPCCRSCITMFLQSFTAEESRTPEGRRCLHALHIYNRRHSGAPRSFIEIISDTPILLRHLVSEMLSPHGLVIAMRIRFMLAFTIAILYVLSPLDLLPEAVFGLLGLLDDVMVMLIMLVIVTAFYRTMVLRR